MLRSGSSVTMRPWRQVSILAVLALLIAACTPGGSPEPTREDAPSRAADSPTTTDGEPPIPILNAETSIVRPGEMLTITADPRLEGDVVLTDGSAETASAAITDGTANLQVPSDLAPGTYVLRLDDQDVGLALGAVRVADGPSLWISGPSWIRSDETPVLTVTTFDVPNDLTVALELAEGTAETRWLVPHPVAGLAPIIPGTDPAPGIGRGKTTWRLPEGFVGTVRAVAAPARVLELGAEGQSGIRFASSAIEVRVCDEPTSIVGNLGASGSVRTIPLSGRGRVAAVTTDDGRFTLPVAPGAVSVAAMRRNGPTGASPQLLSLRCGETLDVGSLDEPVDTGPAPGTYLGGLGLEEAFSLTAQLSGEPSFTIDTLPDCSVSAGTLRLVFDAGDAGPYVAEITVPDFAGSGRYTGEFRIEDVLAGTSATGVAKVVVEQGRIDVYDAVGGEFTVGFEGSFGSGTIEGQYVCAFPTGFDSALTPDAPLALPVIYQPTVFFQAAGAATTEPCRRALVRGEGELQTDISVIDAYAQAIFARTPRLVWATSTMIEDLLKLAAQASLVGGDSQQSMEAIQAILDVDYLLVFQFSSGTDGGEKKVNVRVIDLLERRSVFTGVFTAPKGDIAGQDPLLALTPKITAEVAPRLQKAGICGEVDPKQLDGAAGKKQEATYRVTDLAGEPAEAKIDSVSSKCGTFEPDSGSTSGGEFTTTFTGDKPGCTDQATFVARTGPPTDDPTTEPDATESTTRIVVPTFGYRYVIVFDGSTVIEASDESYSSDSATFRAESEGIFYIDPDFGMVIGAGEGTFSGGDPGFICYAIDFPSGTVTRRIQEWDMSGRFGVMLTGDIAAGTATEGGTVKLDPVGHSISLVASYSDPDCFPEGTMRNEPFSMAFASGFVLRPAVISGLFPEGFEIPFTSDGTPTSRTFPITEGNGTGSITIEVWTQGS